MSPLRHLLRLFLHSLGTAAEVIGNGIRARRVKELFRQLFQPLRQRCVCVISDPAPPGSKFFFLLAGYLWILKRNSALLNCQP